MNNPACIGGLLEVCVGVPDLVTAIADFEAYGCRVGTIGELDARAARALYGVDSALRSVRLAHLDTDHGHVRLMQWERPVNEGLGIGNNLRCVGSRWGVRVASADAKNVSDVLEDEFGRRAFTFDAPDGYQWMLIAA